jgi:hypothetical protein
VFEDRVLRRTFGPRMDEVMIRKRKLNNEELRDLYSSPNIITTIKSRGMSWARHVAQMGRREMYTGYWWERQTERTVHEWVILSWILERYDGGD